MKRRARLRLLLTAVILAAILYHWMGRPLFCRHLYTSVSLGGKYKLEMYSERRWRLMTAPGDGGNRYAHVILRNRWGWKIGESDVACATSDYDAYDEGDIRWDLEKGEVWFAPARGINLRSGKCEM